jgi:hypothetical protein
MKDISTSGVLLSRKRPAPIIDLSEVRKKIIVEGVSEKTVHYNYKIWKHSEVKKLKVSEFPNYACIKLNIGRFLTVMKW